ncbi:putative uncharacterized protein DDB_G0282133 isoform X3 [Adelges cooleyi]|uniref:putative uncharacterized protein DDB_G0282133 isoform X3 n=1 Tax=Adelges cooleyi TaxID=133065 RepID=UPI00217F2D73|nr:putative uncharacterized protein DDB_G0282133 isoform X3 [Adelges cooleyi]
MIKMSPSHTNSFSPAKISSPSSNSKRPLLNTDNEDSSNENDNISSKRKKSCSLSIEDINEAVQTTTRGYMTRHRLLKQLEENNKLKTSQDSKMPINHEATKSKKPPRKRSKNFQKNKKVMPGYVFTNDIVSSSLNFKRIKTKKKRNTNSTPSLFESGSESEEELQLTQTSATTSNTVNRANESSLASDCASTFTKDSGMKKYFNKKSTLKLKDTSNHNIQMGKSNELNSEEDIDVSFCQKKNPAQVFRVIIRDNPSLKSMNSDDTSTLNSNSSECPGDSPRYLLVNNVTGKKTVLEKNTIKSPQVNVNNENTYNTSLQKSMFDLPLTPASVIESLCSDDGSNESINSQRTNGSNLEMSNTFLINSQQTNKEAGQDDLKIKNTLATPIHFDFSDFVATELPQAIINEQTNDADNKLTNKSILVSQTATNTNVIINSCINEKLRSSLPVENKCKCKTYFDLDITLNKILNTKLKHFVFDINTQKARDKFHHQKIAENSALQSLITKGKESLIRPRNNIVNKGNIVKVKPVLKRMNEILEVASKPLKDDHVEPIMTFLKNVSNETVVPNDIIKEDHIEHTAMDISNETLEVVPKTSKKEHIEPIMAILKNVSNKTVVPNDIKEDRIEHTAMNVSNGTSEVFPKTSKINCIEPIINSITNETVVTNDRKESHNIEHDIAMNISDETLGVPKTYDIEPDIMSILNEAYVGVDYHSDSCEFLNEILAEKENDVATTMENTFELDTCLPAKTAESEIKSENTNGYQLNPKCQNSKTIVQKDEQSFDNTLYSSSKPSKNKNQIILKGNFKIEKKESIEMKHVNGNLNKIPKSSTLTFENIFTNDSPVKYESNNTNNQSSCLLKTNLVSKKELNITGQKKVEHKKTHLNENKTSKSITSPKKLFLESASKNKPDKSPIHLSNKQYHCVNSPLKSIIEQTKTTGSINNESTQIISVSYEKNINSDNNAITTNDENNSMANKSISSPNKLSLKSASKNEPNKSPIHLSSNQFHCGNSPLKRVIESTKTTSCTNNEWFSDSETSSDDESTQTMSVSISYENNINSDNSAITTNDEKNSMANKSISSPNKLPLDSASKNEPNKSPIHLSSNQFHCGNSPLKRVIESTKTMPCINNEWFSDSEIFSDNESTQTTSNNVVPVSICNEKKINSYNSAIITNVDSETSSDDESTQTTSNNVVPDSICNGKNINLDNSTITPAYDENNSMDKTLTPSTNVCDTLHDEKKPDYKPCSIIKTTPDFKNSLMGHNEESKSLFGLIQNGLPLLESQYEHNTLTKSMDKVHCEKNTMETIDIPQPSIFNLNLDNSSPATDIGSYDDGKVLNHNNNSTDNDSSDDEGKLQIECDFDNYSDKNSKTLDSLQKCDNNVSLNSSNVLSLCGSNSTSSEDIGGKKVLEPKNMISVFNKEEDLVTNINVTQGNNNELFSLNNFDTNDKDTALPITIVEPKEDQQSSIKVQLDYMSPNLTVDMCNELYLKEYSNNDILSFPKHIQDIFTEMLVDVPYVPMCFHLNVPECDDPEFTIGSIANTKTQDINVNDMPLEISNVDMKEDVGESIGKLDESNETSCEIKTPKKKKKKKKNTALQQKKQHTPKSNMKIRCNLREFINSNKPINEVVESKEFRNLRFFSEEDIACSFGVFLFENTLGVPVINGLEPYKVDYSQLDDAKKFENLRSTNLHIICPKIVRLTLLTLALAKMIRKDSLIHKILNVIRKNILNKKLNVNHQIDNMIITQTTYFVDICVRLRLLKTLQMFIFDSMVLLPNKYCCVIFVSLLMWKSCLPRKLNDQQDPVLVPILSCLIAKQKFYSEQFIGPDIYQRELINLLSFHFNYSFSTELPVNFMQHINKPDFFVSIVLFLKCCNPKDKVEFIVNCLFPIIENYLNTQQNEGNALKTLQALVKSIPPFKTSCNTIVATYVNKYKRLVYPNKDYKEHINITMYNCYKTLQEKFLSYFNDNRNRSRLFEESLATLIMVLGSVDYATSTVALMKWKPKYKLSALLLKKITIFKSVLGSELWDKLCDMDDYNMVNCIINSSLLKSKNVYRVITQVHAIQ